ncbi:hypothetical protein ACU686_03420 [Yinghuangia aomiensis]
MATGSTEPGEPTRVRTVCSYCGVGCGMVLDIGAGPDGRRVVRKASGDKAHPANAGRLCTKGATTADMLAAPGRLEYRAGAGRARCGGRRRRYVGRRDRGGRAAGSGRWSTSTGRTRSRCTCRAR